MNRAIILGCSHATGYEMHLEPGLDISPYTENEYGYSNSYPTTIAKMLGYTPDNRAITGGSNDSIFRIWNEVKDTLDNTDIIIACWTGAHRTEIWDENLKRWLPISVGSSPVNSKEYEEYTKQWLLYHTHRQIGMYNKLKNIVALNSLSEIQGIKVINVDSFTCIPESYQQYLWPAKHSTFLSWAKDKKYPCTPGLHFFKKAHQDFAEFVVQAMGV